jgi:hypothetical protein
MTIVSNRRQVKILDPYLIRLLGPSRITMITSPELAVNNIYKEDVLLQHFMLKVHRYTQALLSRHYNYLHFLKTYNQNIIQNAH